MKNKNKRRVPFFIAEKTTENPTETIEISSQVESISSGAFSSMEGLKNLVIHPDNPNYSFTDGLLLSKNGEILYQALNYLTTLTIPDTVTDIKTMSLTGCNSLTSIFIPKNVVRIEDSVFIISNLKTVDVEEGNPNYESDQGSIYTKGKKELIFYHYGTGNAIVTEGVEVIRPNVFYANNGYTSIQLPQTLKTIMEFGLMGLTKVRTITIPKNVNDLTTSSFPDAKLEVDPESPNYQSVNGIIILSKDGTELVAVSRNVSEYTIPNSVKKIKAKSFYATRVMDIIIPNGVQEIEYSVFDYCDNLKSIEIPSSVTTIGGGAFSRCSQLSEIQIHKPAGSIAGSPWSCPYGERAVKWDS